jgi:sugar diacid utilization regulator
MPDARSTRWVPSTSTIRSLGSSRALGIPRNTLRHRITRCERLPDLGLDDPDVSAELRLLLRLLAIA